jgi:retron-type reverse transcriptase
VIPPADDPRTKLIDRGLVSEGLLAPEDLAEIHAVGAEMDRVRPTFASIEHRVNFAGEHAVRADREQRAAIKEQKKREAAERKTRRAEAIAHRRATDILFLGRGVSHRLHLRESDSAKLQSLGLPVLSTPMHLAEALGLSIPRLRWLAFHSEVASRLHYVRFTVPKKSGGTRLLSAPHTELKGAQHWILVNILNQLPVDETSHGFVRSRSTVTNAAPHVGQQVVLNMDLENFFPSVPFERVRKVFERTGYSPCVATILALLCTECPRQEVTYAGKRYFVATGPRGLPQGACTSPALANHVARRLDRRLHGLAKRFGLSYTRYADDLTLSGNEALRDRVGYVMAKVRHIAQDEGFAINQKKSRVLRRNTAQLVTGIVVNQKPSLCREELRRIRAILHRAKTEGLEKQNRENRPHFVAWLRGKIAYIRMVRPDLGAQYALQLNQLILAGGSS